MANLDAALAAGWRVFEQNAKKVAEKSIALPGATASLIREEAETIEHLVEKIDVRERLLGGNPADVGKVVITNDGTLVTDGQHEALKVDGISVPEAAAPDVPAPVDPQQQVEPEHPKADELLPVAPEAPSVAPVDAGQSPVTEQPVTPPAEPPAPAEGQVTTDTTSDVSVTDTAPGNDEPAPAAVDAPLSDEERAALAANEAALEAQAAAAPPAA